MWKITRNIIFPRFHPNQTKYTTESSQNPVCPLLKSHINVSSSEKKKSSEQNDWKKQRFNKHYWNCADFQFHVSRSIFLETASWISTATVVSFNLHRGKFYSLFGNERAQLFCPFSRQVLAMPRAANQDMESSENTLPPVSEDGIQISVEAHVDSNPNVFQEIKSKSKEYVATFLNSVGLSHLDKDNRKAFRSFLSAARLGSIQGLYNLGICYELGKGTRVNLTRAAFCFRKASMKGHGLASVSLARYFHEGLGGLPVNHETAKLLLEQAADQGIQEAIIFLGLQYLEDGQWSDAFELFSDLASKDDVDATYYLGLCYENGWGVTEDQRTAMEHFSKNAKLGHSRSILSLIKYYEEGLGGCDIDLDFALTLSQMLADQGDDEGIKAVLRLECKKEYEKTKSLHYLEAKKTGLHISSSVPEFTSDKTTHLESHRFSIISSYLNLISDFIPFKTEKIWSENETVFYTGQPSVSSSLMLHLHAKV
ncbi:Death ligand signal enhancer [Araneus ventricosus]|uniref:Death ligand signal enhancer n=2 Tax=Araneus ventricosus TaxID=182803 RepID=A0A4Y2BVC3_ARAVE|nr:Death ligand signal enhancer [Araneus ventricosus]